MIIARIKNNGDLQIKDEIIEYPSELEGGRNLLRNSNFQSGLLRWFSNGKVNIYHDENIGKNYLDTQENTSNMRGVYSRNYNFEIGQEYIISFLAKAPIAPTVVRIGLESDELLHINIAGEWKEYSGIHVRTKLSGIGAFVIYGSNICITDVKVEKGPIATPWTPAPEDLGMEYPDDIQHFATGFRSNGKVLVREFIEGEKFSLSSDKKMYLNELEEGVDL